MEHLKWTEGMECVCMRYFDFYIFYMCLSSKRVKLKLGVNVNLGSEWLQKAINLFVYSSIHLSIKWNILLSGPRQKVSFTYSLTAESHITFWMLIPLITFLCILCFPPFQTVPCLIYTFLIMCIFYIFFI